ncbi:hypothetical protein OSTOST_04814 [Ostertagia ostertagi]
MEECLLLLELGAMPSQSIDVDPCPQNSPCSSTSSRKAKVKTRRKVSKETATPSSCSRSKPVNLNEVNAALASICDRPTTRRSAAGSMSSRRSDLSDSPDRLVIVEDLEGVIVKDPPPDEVPMSQEIVVDLKTPRASSVSSAQTGSLGAPRSEGETSADLLSSRVSRRSPRKRGLEQCSTDIVPPLAKKRIVSSRDQSRSPLSANSPVGTEKQAGAVLKTNDHHTASRRKNELNTFDARISPLSTSTAPSVEIRKSPKHPVVATDKKKLTSLPSAQSESHAEPILPELFVTPAVTRRSAHSVIVEPTSTQITVSLARRTEEGTEAGVPIETCGTVITKASKVVLPCETTVLVPTKIHPSPVSEFSRLSEGVDSTIKVAKRTASADVAENVRGYSRHRRKSSTPPLLVVAVEVTSSFVPVKRDNERSADPVTLPTYNFTEPATKTVFSSDSAEILNALALEIIIREASALSTVNMATFAQFVFNLFEPITPVFGKLVDIEPSNLPANFTTIFELASPLQFRHRLDYNSFNNMLMNRLPENGLHALTLDSRKVSMLKITKFVDTIKEAVSEICEELRTRRTLSKAEIQAEKDLSSEVQHLITSRYVETID